MRRERASGALTVRCMAPYPSELTSRIDIWVRSPLVSDRTVFQATAPTEYVRIYMPVERTPLTPTLTCAASRLGAFDSWGSMTEERQH